MSDSKHDPEQLVREKEREQLIRERAYALWQEDGRPDGQAEMYWERAKHEVEAAENVALAA